jgi:hypothetical protein
VLVEAEAMQASMLSTALRDTHCSPQGMPAVHLRPIGRGLVVSLRILDGLLNEGRCQFLHPYLRAAALSEWNLYPPGSISRIRCYSHATA